MVDHSANRFADQPRFVEPRMRRRDLRKDRAGERHLGQIACPEQARPQPVIDIVVVVGDVVGQRRDLRLRSRKAVEFERMPPIVFEDRGRHRPPHPRPEQRAVVLRRAFQRLPAQIEPVEPGIAVFEPG